MTRYEYRIVRFVDLASQRGTAQRGTAFHDVSDDVNLLVVVTGGRQTGEQEMMNKLGAEGWRLVTLHGDVYYFERVIPG